MTSRERLTRVLKGEMPDRVPISTYELCALDSCSFENREPSYAALMELIRKNTDGIAMWGPKSNGWQVNSAYLPDLTEEEYLEGAYHVERTVVHLPSRTLSGTKKYTEDVQTVWQVEHLCKDMEDVDALMALPFVPVRHDAADYPRIAAEIGDRGIIMASLADPVCVAMELMEFGEATVWALTEPDHFSDTLAELHRRSMVNLKNSLETQAVDLYRICGPEYVTPPYLPPKAFERFVFPYLCEMTDLIHAYGKKVRIHSHGKIGKVLHMLMATGADALDPCEGPPDGDITLGEVKRRTDGMTLFGNLQLKLLEHGSVAEVRQAVKDCMKMAKEGGRYVIMPTASPINIPLAPKTAENYRAFIETALEYGIYG